MKEVSPEYEYQIAEEDIGIHGRNLPRSLYDPEQPGDPGKEEMIIAGYDRALRRALILWPGFPSHNARDYRPRSDRPGGKEILGVYEENNQQGKGIAFRREEYSLHYCF